MCRIKKDFDNRNNRYNQRSPGKKQPTSGEPDNPRNLSGGHVASFLKRIQFVAFATDCAVASASISAASSKLGLSSELIDLHDL